MCDRRISTENGVLTCDLPAGHDGFHHAVHAGGTVVAIDRHKSVSPTPFTDAEGNYLAVHEVALASGRDHLRDQGLVRPLAVVREPFEHARERAFAHLARAARR